MNELFINGYIEGCMKLGNEYIFLLHTPIDKLTFVCKTKLKEVKEIKKGSLIEVEGSIEGMMKVINVIKIEEIK